MREDSPVDVDGAKDVGVELRVGVLGGQVLDDAAVHVGGIVDDDVDGSVVADDGVHVGLDLLERFILVETNDCDVLVRDVLHFSGGASCGNDLVAVLGGDESEMETEA